jgi:Ca2+-binding RTX toxin-like protein
LNRTIESLEPRRLFAVATVMVAVNPSDGFLEITGTRRRDEITVVEHFPGSGIYDVQFAGTFQQGTTQTGIRIMGGKGNDVLTINVNAPIVPVTILGENGNDTLRGSPGDDVLDGGNGRDELDGLAGNDTLRGGAARDILTGGDGNDSLDGGASNDILFGNGGNDMLMGDRGRDTLDGGDGDDFLDGGFSLDRITGGPGADSFATSDRDKELLDVGPDDGRTP